MSEEQKQQDEQTVKVAEMKRRLAKEEEKHQAELDELKEQQSMLIKEAVEKAKAEAQMSEKELRDYKEQEAQYEQQIQELMAEKKQREIRDESINKLGELGIVVNDRTLDLVSAGSLEAMSEKAEQLASVLNDVKNEFASSKAPISGGGRQIKGDNQSLGDFFRAGNIIKNKGD